MPIINTSALVPYTPRMMFALVADVERYPDFLPWCRTATLHARSDVELTASLVIARGPVHKTFTTRNRFVGVERMDIELVDGPFRRLRGSWQFQALHEAGCKVALELDFEFSSRILGRAFAPVFTNIANTMVDAFCRRAGEIYESG